jgi:hypothetical protein
MPPVARSLATAGLVLALAGCVPTDFPSAEPSGPAASPPAASAVTAARTALAHLPVAPARGTGYQRTEDFGSAWVLDADHNGCRQRDDVLRRDLTAVRTSNRCTVVAGTLRDPYSAVSVTFAKARADDVQIDHVYPLSLAWQHGAATWTKDQRVGFANDLANLIATTAAANRTKSDHGPGEWMPRRAYWCTYATRYVTVAAHYRLSVSTADHAALTAALATCPRA